MTAGQVGVGADGFLFSTASGAYLLNGHSQEEGLRKFYGDTVKVSFSPPLQRYAVPGRIP